MFFFFNDTATTEIYTLSLHDALPICKALERSTRRHRVGFGRQMIFESAAARSSATTAMAMSSCTTTARNPTIDRKSTRLNSSHANISYAVFCLKKKTQQASHISIYGE